MDGVEFSCLRGIDGGYGYSMRWFVSSIVHSVRVALSLFSFFELNLLVICWCCWLLLCIIMAVSVHDHTAFVVYCVLSILKHGHIKMAVESILSAL